MTRALCVGDYLVSRLEKAGLKHVFGIPGDYVLGLFELLRKSSLSTVGTCTEIGAGFAADAYARVNGLGAVCVTYCVGGLNLLNAVAGAYAEKSPVIFISGAPGLGERARSPLLHHRVREFDMQQRIFEKVTVAAESLEDPSTAARQIDHAISACIRHKRPVYLELPRDIVSLPCGKLPSKPETPPKSDPEALKEALDEASAMLRAAKRPVILAGVEMHRFGLQALLLRFVDDSGFPIAATLLGKSIVSERHPQYIGVYEGAMGREDVRRTVERADCVLILGAFMTDINLGVYTSNIDVSRTINATSERISIRHHHFERIMLRDFVDGLRKSNLGRRRAVKVAQRTQPRTIRLQAKRPLTIRRFFARMNEFLTDDSIVIADIGDSLFGAADLTIHRRTEFLSPAYYTSMGFAVPAALGAQIAKRKLRPIVFVGDGAFQMTGQELSTIVRHGLNPIIFVLNNKGYATERFIQDGPYNDLQEWAYHAWPAVLQQGVGIEVRTEGELAEALPVAVKNTKTFTIINAHFDPLDRSQAMERLGRRLSAKVGLKKRG
jgi:indolepyruvate decarboxylase